MKNYEASINSLKKALASAPIRTYPQLDKQLILYTDTSNEDIGFILSHDLRNKERAIPNYSKSLGNPERNYSVTREEFLVINKATDNFLLYLYGRKFILRTYPASLKWLSF
ncbi:retrovirus-related Pol polyprotein from transposon 297 [Nephila pilipes]|uniref:Retrovirus-related Pol polyprotein from transposon 297 n=1 Tax=Nephila pilipes TaxID=299642 RepID=A0A8X6NHJ2_NEPPI|nr:retrovirus-related Pol polyprotein from transposon 297 [Nephila pilipes]